MDLDMANFKYLDLKYSEVFIFDNFLVKQIRDGQVVGDNHLEELTNIINTYFKSKPFVYLSNRVHSYSVNPLLLQDMASIHNLMGIGVITENSQNNNAKNNASYERSFSTLPFEIFETLAEAIIWVNKLVKENS